MPELIARQAGPALPTARGPMSAAVLDAFRHSHARLLRLVRANDADPFGDDLALALHLCYELHYRGWDGVPAEREWDSQLLAFRADLEKQFLAGLKNAVSGGSDVAAEIDKLLVEPAESSGVTHFLRDAGHWWQMREYFVHRSIYHLKEADPHAWVIPRLYGRAKAALVAVEFDEFGGGRPDRVHAQLFADLLAAAELDDTYLGYLDHVPACSMAIVNMMSLFGLHRRWRGALVGHFAAAEISTAPSAQRLVAALERMDAPQECRFFYTEHIEADAVHEQVMRHDVIDALLEDEPELADDLVFGMQSTDLLEEWLAGHMLDAWRGDRSSLRTPLTS